MILFHHKFLKSFLFQIVLFDSDKNLKILIIKNSRLYNIVKSEKSITGKYLSHKYNIPIPKTRRLAKNGRFLEINGATGNNLKNVNI